MASRSTAERVNRKAPAIPPRHKSRPKWSGKSEKTKVTEQPGYHADVGAPASDVSLGAAPQHGPALSEQAVSPAVMPLQESALERSLGASQGVLEDVPTNAQVPTPFPASHRGMPAPRRDEPVSLTGADPAVPSPEPAEQTKLFGLVQQGGREQDLEYNNLSNASAVPAQEISSGEKEAAQQGVSDGLSAPPKSTAVNMEQLAEPGPAVEHVPQTVPGPTIAGKDSADARTDQLLSSPSQSPAPAPLSPKNPARLRASPSVPALSLHEPLVDEHSTGESDQRFLHRRLLHALEHEGQDHASHATDPSPIPVRHTPVSVSRQLGPSRVPEGTYTIYAPAAPSVVRRVPRTSHKSRPTHPPPGQEPLFNLPNSRAMLPAAVSSRTIAADARSSASTPASADAPGLSTSSSLPTNLHDSVPRMQNDLLPPQPAQPISPPVLPNPQTMPSRPVPPPPANVRPVLPPVTGNERPPPGPAFVPGSMPGAHKAGATGPPPSMSASSSMPAIHGSAGRRPLPSNLMTAAAPGAPPPGKGKSDLGSAQAAPQPKKKEKRRFFFHLPKRQSETRLRDLFGPKKNANAIEQSSLGQKETPPIRALSELTMPRSFAQSEHLPDRETMVAARRLDAPLKQQPSPWTPQQPAYTPSTNTAPQGTLEPPLEVIHVTPPNMKEARRVFETRVPKKPMPSKDVPPVPTDADHALPPSSLEGNREKPLPYAASETLPSFPSYSSELNAVESVHPVTSLPLDTYAMQDSNDAVMYDPLSTSLQEPTSTHDMLFPVTEESTDAVEHDSPQQPVPGTFDTAPASQDEGAPLESDAAAAEPSMLDRMLAMALLPAGDEQGAEREGEETEREDQPSMLERIKDMALGTSSDQPEEPEHTDLEAPAAVTSERDAAADEAQDASNQPSILERVMEFAVPGSTQLLDEEGAQTEELEAGGVAGQLQEAREAEREAEMTELAIDSEVERSAQASLQSDPHETDVSARSSALQPTMPPETSTAPAPGSVTTEEPPEPQTTGAEAVAGETDIGAPSVDALHADILPNETPKAADTVLPSTKDLDDFSAGAPKMIHTEMPNAEAPSTFVDAPAVTHGEAPPTEGPVTSVDAPAVTHGEAPPTEGPVTSVDAPAVTHGEAPLTEGPVTSVDAPAVTHGEAPLTEGPVTSVDAPAVMHGEASPTEVPVTSVDASSSIHTRMLSADAPSTSVGAPDVMHGEVPSTEAPVTSVDAPGSAHPGMLSAEAPVASIDANQPTETKLPPNEGPTALSDEHIDTWKARTSHPETFTASAPLSYPMAVPEDESGIMSESRDISFADSAIEGQENDEHTLDTYAPKNMLAGALPSECTTCEPPSSIMTTSAAQQSAVEQALFNIPAPIPPEQAEVVAKPCLIIEYCERCRWLHRATWLQTELLITFSQKNVLDKNASKASGGGYLASSMLIPHSKTNTSGQFRVWVVLSSGPEDTAEVVLMWDRKTRGGFPELRELKNLIRDKVAPSQHLGHSELKHSS